MADIPDAYKKVPMMFRAQTNGRCQLQRLDPDRRETRDQDRKPQDAEMWCEEWTSEVYSVAPRFEEPVKTREYSISWRFVTNSGQDDGVIRPVIGASGYPFYPGSSMKGAFRQACKKLFSDRVGRYCGEELTNGDFTPGILRFHGGYPTDDSWCDDLVDLVHPQQERQVMNIDINAKSNAFIQISLYQPKIQFGISASDDLEESEWKEVWQIWEKALSYGLGSRVSAGYGYVNGVGSSDRVIWSVNIKGQGLASKLLNSTAEFRPNMFKATLRGHTLRILAGLIADPRTVQRLNAQIWGDTESYQANNRQPVVGLVGVRFSHARADLELDTFRYNNNNVRMPIYELERGKLEILGADDRIISNELSEFLRYILRFSLVIGGFGKSCRRTDHRLFHPTYLNGSKPMIGCHWEILPQPVDNIILTANSTDLRSFRKFFENVRQTAIDWLATQDIQPNGCVNDWREVWHQDRVQVWGRISKTDDSQAVRWYHDTNRLKNTSLGGEANRGVRGISRSYHRMYPRVVKPQNELKRIKDEYIEVLTLFPDNSQGTQRFLNFIAEQGGNGWIRLW